MYNLLQDKTIGTKAKKSGSIVSNDGTMYIKYVGTPTKEHYYCYSVENDTPLGALSISKTLLRELNTYSESVKGTGNYVDILSCAGLAPDTYNIWDVTKFEEDEKPRGNTFNLKGFVYENVQTDSSFTSTDMSNILETVKDITDLIYKTKPLKEHISENRISLAWLSKKDYKILTTRDEFEEFMEELDKYDSSEMPVGFDTETSGLMVNRHKLDVLVGLCMSVKDHSGVYIPLNQLRFKNIEVPFDEVLARLKPYIDARASKRTRKNLLTHNGQFDWKVLKMYDIELNIVHDTLIMQAVLNIGVTGTLMKLKAITSEYLGYDVLELEDLYTYPSKEEFLFIKQAIRKGVPCNEITKRKIEMVTLATPKDLKDNLLDFRFAEEDFVRVYGSADADFPRLIFRIMQKEFNQVNESEGGKLSTIYNLEINMIPVLGEQEFYGVKVIREGFERLNRETSLEMKELEQKIYAHAGKEFKIGGKETADIFYDGCNIPYNPRYKTTKGARSVDKHALEYYSQILDAYGEPKYPIAVDLQKYNKKKTQVSSFYSKLPKLVVNDFIFPQYNSIRAETGRLTCSKPNIQQTEPSSRKYMVAEDGYYFMICDYSQVEYRLMNGLAKEEKNVRFFANDKEADFHIMAYSNMHGIPYAKVTSKQRKQGKGLNFGTSYGLSDKALALMLFGNDDLASQIKARQAKEQYFAGIPNVLKYFEKQRDIAQETCYAHTLFGRRRYIKEFAQAKQENGRKKEMLIAKGRRVAGNMPVQGLAADIMKMALIRVRKNLRNYGYLEDMARLVMNVHDEVCIQVHKSIHPYLMIKIIREAMEIDFSSIGLPPLYVGGNVGYDWGDGKADDLEAPVDLMDRMIAIADEHLKSKTPFPTVEDPKQLWYDDILKYNLEVIDSQSKIGYIDPEDPEEKRVLPISTIDDALKSVRIAKYINHDAYVSPRKSILHDKMVKDPQGVYILGWVMSKGAKYVYDNLDLLLSKGKEISIKNLNRVKSTGKSFEELRNSIGARTFAEYFNVQGFGGDILNFARDNDNISDIIFEDYLHLGKVKYRCKIETLSGNVFVFEKPTLKLDEAVVEITSEQLKEKEKTIREEIEQYILIDGNKLVLDTRKIPANFLSIIYDLFMPMSFIKQNLKPENSKSLRIYTIGMDSEAENPSFVTNSRLLEVFVPLVKELIFKALVDDKNVKDIYDKVDIFIKENNI